MFVYTSDGSLSDTAVADIHHHSSGHYQDSAAGMMSHRSKTLDHRSPKSEMLPTMGGSSLGGESGSGRDAIDRFGTGMGKKSSSTSQLSATGNTNAGNYFASEFYPYKITNNNNSKKLHANIKRTVTHKRIPHHHNFIRIHPARTPSPPPFHHTKTPHYTETYISTLNPIQIKPILIQFTTHTAFAKSFPNPFFRRKEEAAFFYITINRLFLMSNSTTFTYTIYESISKLKI